MKSSITNRVVNKAVYNNIMCIESIRMNINSIGGVYIMSNIKRHGLGSVYICTRHCM